MSVKKKISYHTEAVSILIVHEAKRNIGKECIQFYVKPKRNSHMTQNLAMQLGISYWNKRYIAHFKLPAEL